jgi:hypothetical protein
LIAPGFRPTCEQTSPLGDLFADKRDRLVRLMPFDEVTP